AVEAVTRCVRWRPIGGYLLVRPGAAGHRDARRTLTLTLPPPRGPEARLRARVLAFPRGLRLSRRRARHAHGEPRELPAEVHVPGRPEALPRAHAGAAPRQRGRGARPGSPGLGRRP